LNQCCSLAPRKAFIDSIGHEQALAGDVTKATNKADCDKAGGMWDAQTNKCSKKSGSY
jgi:hypothetical protein